MNRLEKFTFSCHVCENIITVDYEHFNQQIKNKKYFEDEDLSLKNINAVVNDIYCSKCNKEGRGKVKDFSLFDANAEVLFNTRVAIICDCCDLMIPIPRTNNNPDIKTCVTCLENEEVKKDAGTIFPDLPPGISRSCPRCDGLKKIYLNNADKTFFVGCSNYIGPKKDSCHWTTNEYFDYLNNPTNTIADNSLTKNSKAPGWIINNDQGKFNFSVKKSFIHSTVEQIPHNLKGIYRIWKKRSNDDVCIYIGKSDTCLRRRILEHYPDKEKNIELRNILQSSSELLIDLKIMNDKSELIRQHEKDLIKYFKPQTNNDFIEDN